MKILIFVLLLSFCLGVESLNSANALLQKSKDFSKDRAREHLAAIPNPFGADSAPIALNERHLHLQAILNKKVLINDEWLSVNDDISGFKIIHITPKYITLQKSNAHYTVKLNEPLP